MNVGMLGRGCSVRGLAIFLIGLANPLLSETEPVAFRAYRPVGAGSCAARACHGSTEQDFTFQERYRSSHTTWILRDKHSRASEVLHNSRSKAIAARLGLAEEAHRADRCLACHAASTTALPADRPELALQVRSDGVSCEACHGAAERWLEPHLAFDWKRKPSAEKQDKYGMHSLDTLSARAESCVGCHVGAEADSTRGLPLRDMNHEMIAAGHPRLSFEFLAYLDQMPKHWNEKLPPENYRAEAWLVGQLTTARASCELTASRAKRTQKDPQSTAWPEFSEYNCYSCHFQLAPEPSWRSSGKASADIGLPEWGSWIRPRLQDLSSSPAKRTDLDMTIALTELADRMRMDRSNPSAAEPKATRLAT